MDFTPKRTTEQEVFTVDFTLLLAPGETITSASWGNSAVRGIDATAPSMIQGAATINGSRVSQVIKGGVIDVFYAPTCTAVTNAGQTLVLPVYGDGLLHVTA